MRRRMTVWLHEQRTSVAPFGTLDQTAAFNADRIAGAASRRDRRTADLNYGDASHCQLTIPNMRQPRMSASNTRCVE